MRKRFQLADMEHSIRETLSEGGTFQFYPRGTSMEPLIHQGRDMVVLCAIPERLKKYQMILYKRENGAFVLHRIVKICPDSYTMRGDNQYVLEPGIRRDQMIGMVCYVVKDGRKVEANTGLYHWKAVFWVETVGIRQFVSRVRGYLGRIKRKVLRKG